MRSSERTYGSQMSTIEKELLFNRENTGFVRFARNSKRSFYLDPSPFMRNTRNEIFYMLNGLAPEKNELVKVQVEGSECTYSANGAQYEKTIIKYVSNWETIDVQTLIRDRSPLDFEEVIDYLKMPYIGDAGVLECIGMGSALYISSTPPSDQRTGGINAAVLGKQKSWNAYSSSMNTIIPSDLRKLSSEYYYKISEQDQRFEAGQKREVSLSYLNPKLTPMHLPVILDVDDVKGRRKLNELCQEDYPVLNAHLIDALMLQPRILEDIDAHIVEKTYELKNDLIEMGGLPYNQDLGSSISMMSLAYARLQHRTRCTKEDVNEVFDFWVEMTHNTSRELSTPVSPDELYGLKRYEKTLYTDICKAFGTDVDVTVKEAMQATALKEPDFWDALEKLNLKGYVLRRNNQQNIRILSKV